MGHHHPGKDGAFIANEAAFHATVAAANQKNAAQVAGSKVAANVAAEAAAASQIAQAAAAHKESEAAHITQAAANAQATAFAEGALAGKISAAEQAAKITAAMSVRLAETLDQAANEANALANQAASSLGFVQDVLAAQKAMAWQAQQEADSLSKRQHKILHDLQSAQAAASQAQAAATKAIAKANGSQGFHKNFRGLPNGYHH